MRASVPSSLHHRNIFKLAMLQLPSNLVLIGQCWPDPGLWLAGHLDSTSLAQDLSRSGSLLGWVRPGSGDCSVLLRWLTLTGVLLGGARIIGPEDDISYRRHFNSSFLKRHGLSVCVGPLFLIIFMFPVFQMMCHSILMEIQNKINIQSCFKMLGATLVH